VAGGEPFTRHRSLIPINPRLADRWQTVEIGPAADLFLFRFLIIFLRQRGKRGRLRGSGRGRREGSERRMVFQQPPN
jgi:hypothetical protein